MPQKLTDILAEISVMDRAITKTASKRGSRIEELASTIDKLAEEMSDKDEGEEDENEESAEDEQKEHESDKEASMKVTQELVDKIAGAVISKLEKIAVQDTANTQGCGELSSVAPNGANDGSLYAGAQAVKDRHLIDGSKVEQGAESNPERHQISGTGDLVDGVSPNSLDKVAPLQEKKSSVLYSAEEAEVLQKLASVGYETLVEYHSDRIVREKIAEAVVAEQAKQAPAKIAQALVNQKQAGMMGDASSYLKSLIKRLLGGDPAAAQEAAQVVSADAGGAMGGGMGAPAMGGMPQALPKAASVKEARAKLAAAAQQDPQVLAALRVLASKNLIA